MLPGTPRGWRTCTAAPASGRPGASSGATCAKGFEPSIRRILDGEAHGPGGQPAAEFAETVAAMEESARRRPSMERVQMLWLYRLIFTPFPLQEVMTLAWHGHYATSQAKVKSPELMLAQNQSPARAVAGADQPAPPPDARRRRHAALARRSEQHQGPAQREPGARVPRAVRPGRGPLHRARRPRGRAGADRLARGRFQQHTRSASTRATSTTAPRRSWARPAAGAWTTWCGSPAGKPAAADPHRPPALPDVRLRHRRALARAARTRWPMPCGPTATSTSPEGSSSCSARGSSTRRNAAARRVKSPVDFAIGAIRALELFARRPTWSTWRST